MTFCVQLLTYCIRYIKTDQISSTFLHIKYEYVMQKFCNMIKSFRPLFKCIILMF